jgi:type VI protein secretion system component VasF
MPDLWDTNPDNIFNGHRKKPDSAPNGNNDHTKEVPLRDHRGRLRLPAYVLIALVVALAAILLLITGVLFAHD